MPTDREIAIYALGKTEGVHSIAETLGKGLDDEKYIESWKKTMKMLGIDMPLKDLEKIYNEFAMKMEEIVKKDEIKKQKQRIFIYSKNKPIILKAIILAGGRGKRLRPITDYVPKPLVPLKNIPIIEWQIKYLKKFGIDEIIICTGYKQETIENHLNVKKIGMKINFSVEKSPLGTGGAIKKAGKMINEKSFFVINGDTITNIDLNKLKKKSNAIASIELRTNFGILETDDGKITKFREKKEISDSWMNAGIYHLEKEILKDLPSKGDIEKTVFPDYAKKGKLNTVKFKNVKWYSIDSFKDMEECSLEVEKIIK